MLKKRILSISAQKPNSTGSGVYLTELVNVWDKMSYEQAVVAGIEENEIVTLPERVQFYPVHFKSEKLPFPVVGMSDVMPYDNTRYCDMTKDMEERFCNAFRDTISKALEEFQPDLVLCHHLYLTTAIALSCVEEYRKVSFKPIKIMGLCHSTCLRQFQKNELCKEFIKEKIQHLDKILALHSGQKHEIVDIFAVYENKVKIIGAGYNEEIFPRKDYRPTDKITLCFAGKISQAKGVKSLLRAMKEVTSPLPLELSLAGGTGDEKEYREIVKLGGEVEEKGNRKISFVGKLSQDKLSQLYISSHIFVLPSFYEGLPLTMLEALGSGCLVIGATWNGVEEWVKGKVPKARIEFVELPAMISPGVPVEEGLPVYEKNLQKAIEEMIQQVVNGEKQCDGTELTWGCVAKNILEIS